jgi:hypothetical protein
VAAAVSNINKYGCRPAVGDSQLQPEGGTERFSKIVSLYPSLFNDVIFLNRNKDGPVPLAHMWVTVAFMRPLYSCVILLHYFHVTTIFARSNIGLVDSNPA